MSIPTAYVARRVIQYGLEITNMITWRRDHGHTLNDNKTKLMLFKKQAIDHPTTISHLSSIILRYSKWLFKTILAKMSTLRVCRSLLLGVLTFWRLKKFQAYQSMNKAYQIKAYQSIVYNSITVSALEYNYPFFIGMTKSNSDTLEKIRKKCHCIFCGSDCDCTNFFPTLSQFSQIFPCLNLTHPPGVTGVRISCTLLSMSDGFSDVLQ